MRRYLWDLYVWLIRPGVPFRAEPSSREVSETARAILELGSVNATLAEIIRVRQSRVWNFIVFCGTAERAFELVNEIGGSLERVREFDIHGRSLAEVGCSETLRVFEEQRRVV